MNGSIILKQIEKSGSLVYEGDDTRPLRKSGGAFVTSFSKDVLELLGVVDENQLVDEIGVTQRYQIFVDRGELVIQERIPIQDASALRERVAEPSIEPLPETAD